MNSSAEKLPMEDVEGAEGATALESSPEINEWVKEVTNWLAAVCQHWAHVLVLNIFYVVLLVPIVSVLITTTWVLDEGAMWHDLRNPRSLLAIRDKWLISDAPQRISDFRHRKSRKTLFLDTHENDFAAQRPTLVSETLISDTHE